MTYTNKAGWIRRRSVAIIVTMLVLMTLVVPAQADPGRFTLRESGSIICGSGSLRSHIHAYGDHKHVAASFSTEWDNPGGYKTTEFVYGGYTTWSWKLYNQTGYLYDSAGSWATCA